MNKIAQTLSSHVTKICFLNGSARPLNERTFFQKPRPFREYLYLLNGGLELRRAVGPLFQQLHSFIEILHILGVHLEKGCELLQDIPDTRRGRPAGRKSRRSVSSSRCEEKATCLDRLSSCFRQMLTIPPCASPDPGEETDCGRCEWRRCWRRCSSQHRQGTSPYLPPPLA